MLYNLELLKEAENKERKELYQRYRIGNYEVVATTYESGYKSLSIYPDRDQKYLPEIYFIPAEWYMGGEDRFSIQTTSYGALPEAEILKVMTAMQEALEVVRILREELIDKKEEGNEH